MRRVVTGALEVARRDKVIGSSLEAAPVVHVDAETKVMLDALPFDDVCIVSGVTVTDAPAPQDAMRGEGADDVAVEFRHAEGGKWPTLLEGAAGRGPPRPRRGLRAVRRGVGPDRVVTDADIAATLAALAEERARKTFCPSEAARRLAADWRPLMDDVRRVAAGMEGLRATQGGVAVDPVAATGPIRLSKA